MTGPTMVPTGRTIEDTFTDYQAAYELVEPLVRNYMEQRVTPTWLQLSKVLDGAVEAMPTDAMRHNARTDAHELHQLMPMIEPSLTLSIAMKSSDTSKTTAPIRRLLSALRDYFKVGQRSYNPDADVEQAIVLTDQLNSALRNESITPYLEGS